MGESVEIRRKIVEERELLKGESVVLRREFIEENALLVSNLDV